MTKTLETDTDICQVLEYRTSKLKNWKIPKISHIFKTEKLYKQELAGVPSDNDAMIVQIIHTKQSERKITIDKV